MATLESITYKTDRQKSDFTFDTFATSSGMNLGLSMYFLSFLRIASEMLFLSYSISFFKKALSPNIALADCQSVLGKS